MPRQARVAPGGFVYHVLNRAVARPRNWVAAANTPLWPKELEALRLCVARSRPFGDEAWQARTATRLGLLHTLRAEGRPRKKSVAESASHGDN
jgi:hypothetical protein